MFGLMRMRGCGLGHAARELRRHQYCGTCKVMGREYGHGSRFLLNHDTVLLSEIMTALTEEPEWGLRIHSHNCLRLPQRAESVPVALKYAAAVTVFLAAAKVRDHVEDSGRLHWKVLLHWLNPRYHRSAATLRRWGVPVDEIERRLRSQRARESSPQSLEQLAAPTVFATATICRHAALVAARSDAADQLEDFGRRFGYFVYLIDAWEDFERDRSRGQFNAFAAIYGKRAPGRPGILAAADEVEDSFLGLPVPEEFRRELIVRLRANLAARLSESLPVIGQSRISSGVIAAAGMPGSFPGLTAFAEEVSKPANEKKSGSEAKGCRSNCTDCCLESCCEGICESICG